MKNTTEITKMTDQELKAKWVDALRSGKYKQGQRFLRSGDDNYCCLGVLADIVDPHWIPDKVFDELVAYKWTDGSRSFLPRHTLDHLGISQDSAWDLVDMNDVSGKTFSEIADWIERNF